MGLLKIYLRVLALLGPEKWLTIALALANAALAAVLVMVPLALRINWKLARSPSSMRRGDSSPTRSPKRSRVSPRSNRPLRSGTLPDGMLPWD